VPKFKKPPKRRFFRRISGGLGKNETKFKFAGEIPAAILNCHTTVRNFRRRHRGSAYVSGHAIEVVNFKNLHPRFSLSRQCRCLGYA
jgi:hypothetical protein